MQDQNQGGRNNQDNTQGKNTDKSRQDQKQNPGQGGQDHNQTPGKGQNERSR